jgi:multidrug efflux system membrane fusion protein
MRLLPLITAILVSGFLYIVVFERDTLVAFAQGGVTATDETAEADAENTKFAVGVVAVHSEATVIDSAVILRGETQAARQVDVRAETTGQVISEPLRKGSYVEAGQVLCQIDPGTRDASVAEAMARLAEAKVRVPEAQARLTEAEARLAEAQINDRAASRLSQDGFASETRVAATTAAVSSAQAGVQAAKSGLESARTGIQSAEAILAAAEKEIDRLTITAPFEGLLESDTAEIGSLLQPGALCATIIQLDPIKLVGFVPETDVDRVTVGAMAGAQLASGTEVTGKVSFLSRSADPTTRTFQVEVAVPNADLKIRDGQTAEILIAADGEKAHLLPASALTLNDEGTLGVRVVAEDSTALFNPVTLLRDTAQGAWLAGLPENADVIVVGQEYVTDGVAVIASFEELK